MAGGRPTDYNFALAKEICDKVREGSNIKKALSLKSEYPSFPTWCKWKRENAELLNLYVNSIQDKAESVDEFIDDTLSDLRAGLIDASTANVIIQTYKWKAAKYYPKMFGDKQEIDHKSSDGTMTPVDLSMYTDEEKKMLLKIARNNEPISKV